MALTPEERRARKRAQMRAYYWKHRDEILAGKRTPKGREYNRQYQARMRRVRPERYDTGVKALRAHEIEAGRPKPEHCEICGAGTQRIHFDHCHQRGHFRGWICSNCNTALGLVNDDPNRLRQLIAYLERTVAPVPRPQLELPI